MSYTCVIDEAGKVSREHIDRLFQYLAEIGNPSNKIEKATLAQHVTPDVTIHSNGEVLCRTLDECADYIAKMQSKYTRVSYPGFVEPPVMLKEEGVLHFLVECTLNDGSSQLLNGMAIVRMQQGKLSYWSEVFHTQEERKAPSN